MASRDANQAGHTSELAVPSNQIIEETATLSYGKTRIERVFPIRIQDPIKQELAKGQERISERSVGEVQSPVHGSTQPDLLSDPLLASKHESIAPSISVLQPAQEEGSSPGLRYTTNRFTYVSGHDESSTILPAGGGKIYRCEDEPIHIPGAIQRFGVLVAVREEESGSFLVRIVSENARSVTGLEPEDLFQLRCFTHLLSPPDRNEFVIRAHSLRTEESPIEPDVFSISMAYNLGVRLPVFCAMHFNTDSDLIICEFELDQNIISPEHPQNNLPDEPVQIINDEASEAERLLSTTRRSKPLHSLEIARASSRQLTLMDLFQTHSEIQSQLSVPTTLSQLGDTIVGLVHDLTGFHRVMIYQFDDTAAGSVVSELIDPRASKDIYRGLHFPASDIPKQARELYMINTIRILYDREQDTAQLVCRTFEDANIPLNLKHSYLRSMSPIHLKYLANMGVRASMSISLIVDNKLWGLISCHHYSSSSGIHVSLPIREVCRGLGNIASSNVQKLLFASRISARRSLAKAPPTGSPFVYITSSTSELLKMFGADFGFLVIKGEARTIGQLFAYREAIALLQYIRQRPQPAIFYSSAIATDFPDLYYAPGFPVISGMLVIPLSHSRTDFLVFFRKGQLKEIKWAGNPYEKQLAAGTEYLQPRSSFQRWSESVVGTSREWTEDEIESASVLTTLYSRFIEVWRQKEAIVQRNRMTRLLIRNAGHEVRTPLNSIINYLEVALEEELDERARSHLQKSLQASKSLVFVVNDLLHLTEAEESDFQVHEDNIDLRSLISEVAATFREEAIRKNLRIGIKDDTAVPQVVRCDPSGLRQVVSNLLANALQSSDDGEIKIILEHVQTTETTSVVKISFADDGKGFLEEQLDSIFQDFEQILDDDGNPTSGDQETKIDRSRPAQIGLGLATVARFVRLHSGQIGMSSEGEGKGTIVSISIPFRKALSGDFSGRPGSSSISLPTPPSDFLISKTPKSPGSGSSSSTGLRIDGAAISQSSPVSTRDRFPFPIAAANDRPRFNVLVAEDNPLNSHLLEMRLKKWGHAVSVVPDGKACVDAFKSGPHEFDIVLMDIQMPLVDGVEATRMIRGFEKEASSTIELSPRVMPYGRIPIVAVSASLSEQRVHEYVKIGFDGWTLKPIDFKRLEAILTAIEDEQTREVLLYGEGNWSRGGWFKVKNEA